MWVHVWYGVEQWTDIHLEVFFEFILVHICIGRHSLCHSGEKGYVLWRPEGLTGLLRNFSLVLLGGGEVNPTILFTLMALHVRVRLSISSITCPKLDNLFFELKLSIIVLMVLMLKAVLWKSWLVIRLWCWELIYNILPFCGIRLMFQPGSRSNL